MKKIVMIKLGGGLIAPKEWAWETPDGGVIGRLVKEIKSGSGDRGIVLVSGSGNFGHQAVKKYGIDTEDGVEKVRKSAGKIGAIVAGDAAAAGLKIELIVPHEIWPNGRTESVSESLKAGNTVVLYGDVMGIGRGEWKVWSGEKLISETVKHMNESGREIGMIIQVSREEGVWDKNGKIIPEINQNNWRKIRSEVGGATGTDVTGGMLHKVEESLEITRKFGIKTWIISGRVKGRLEKLLAGEKVFGTVVG
ncbi:MAG: Archaeal Kinase [Candidatus Amesbacteria bacterium GW2011_GWB1_47_19]|nr:MAG: Archaeal Kinase [Candidatus Amesbacteria bacterium GW2011_GWA1_44_24]KKU31929.1 MAG: Archaeal Kinase [Candidatus Amesbacteria bacterium GW2011_GWC1_46_24]KKU66865.1 MAG: Archaeal Kinase [Candidatus Amesbacteria bacterium GW2011_GWB1_47_19]